jgi:serine protease AprX
MKYVWFVFSLLLIYPTIVSSQMRGNIDSRLLAREASVLQNIVVVLKATANLSKASDILRKEEKTAYVYHQLLLTSDQSQQEVITFLQSKNISFRRFYIVNMVSLKADKTIIEALALLPSVDKVIEDSAFFMEEAAMDRESDAARGIEWNVTKIKAPDVWNMGYTGQNVVIGGQDTGYEWDDATLKDKYRGWNGSTASHDFNWHDAIYANNANNTGTNPCGYNLSVPCDDHNHGTHTMGTMVGDDGAGNQIGVAPGAKWIGCRNMERGWGTLTTYTECFEWFLAPYAYGSTPSNGDPSKMPHVINNSWGCPPEEGCNVTNFSVMETAVNNLRTAGCVIVVSAGNSGSSCSTVSSPAAIFEGSFSVGASNSADAIASFSSRGPVTVDGSNRLKPNVSGPGVSVRSCIKGVNAYATWSGTSMAGPHIAATVALLISANPSLAGQVDKIEDIIEQTAIHLTSTQTCGTTSGSVIPNNTFGFGRVDALAAVQLATVETYVPYIKTQNDVLINNVASGIVFSDINNVMYRVTMANDGNLNINSTPSISPNSTTIDDASIMFNGMNTGVFLKSSDNNLWKIGVDINGQITTTNVSLPASYLQNASGDLYVKDGIKGVVVKDSAGNCHLLNITTLGNLITVPTACSTTN